MEFLRNPIFLLALTFVVYGMSKMLQRRVGLSLFNPILIAVSVLICFLLMSGIDYSTYYEGGKYIDFWLKPAVVALGVPLYKQLSTIRQQIVPIIVAELVGCVLGIVSVVVVGELFGASREVIVSLAPKSVTTPIAMEVSRTLGGIPALTAGVVVCAGIFGGIAGFKFMKISHIQHSSSQGLAIGTGAHAIGTATAMEKNERCGSFSSLGLTLNGLFTALLTPFILSLFGY